jgi:hypothetical protein
MGLDGYLTGGLPWGPAFYQGVWRVECRLDLDGFLGIRLGYIELARGIGRRNYSAEFNGHTGWCTIRA